METDASEASLQEHGNSGWTMGLLVEENMGLTKAAKITSFQSVPTMSKVFIQTAPEKWPHRNVSKNVKQVTH